MESKESMVYQQQFLQSVPDEDEKRFEESSAFLWDNFVNCFGSIFVVLLIALFLYFLLSGSKSSSSNMSSTSSADVGTINLAFSSTSSSNVPSLNVTNMDNAMKHLSYPAKYPW